MHITLLTVLLLALLHFQQFEFFPVCSRKLLLELSEGLNRIQRYRMTK